jgi:hypothetical protein
VLALLAAGRSNGQMGEQLFISTKTASVHLSNILRKLGVSSRVEAAAFAREGVGAARRPSSGEVTMPASRPRVSLLNGQR